MLEFDSFEELKKFMDSISDFLLSSHVVTPLPPPTCGPLDDTEKNIIINIYKSYKENGKTIKQIAGNFLHLLQLLVPSHNFTDIFKHLIYLEWMEHRIKPDPTKRSKAFYRDHILHCANVCWVGHRLIFDLEEPLYDHIKSCLEKLLPKKCKDLLKDEDDWMSLIKTTWYITAVVHDFGYPIELVERKYTSDKLYLCSKNFLGKKSTTNYFAAHFPGKIPVFENQLRKIDVRMFNEPFNYGGKVHAVIGSLELLHFLEANYTKLISRSELYLYIYQLAALGIFEHHKKDGEIDFDLNPFGYILALADTIHEWHRYTCTGTARGGSTKPGFISPITKVTIKREGVNLYKILYKINPHWKKCSGWNPGYFKKDKKEELNRLKTKPGFPQFTT